MNQVFIVASLFEAPREAHMPARDIYHNAVKNALVKDGWTITDDPLHLKWEEPIGKLLLDQRLVQLLVFNPQMEAIRQWIPSTPSET